MCSEILPGANFCFALLGGYIIRTLPTSFEVFLLHMHLSEILLIVISQVFIRTITPINKIDISTLRMSSKIAFFAILIDNYYISID